MAVTLSIFYLPIFPLPLVTYGKIYLVFILGFHPVFCLFSDQYPIPPPYLSGWLDAALKRTNIYGSWEQILARGFSGRETKSLPAGGQWRSLDT